MSQESDRRSELAHGGLVRREGNLVVLGPAVWPQETLAQLRAQLLWELAVETRFDDRSMLKYVRIV